MEGIVQGVKALGCRASIDGRVRHHGASMFEVLEDLRAQGLNPNV